MRSRDGNNHFSFSIYAIIFFFTFSLEASEYLISYRYVVKDAILYNEKISISRAMQKCQGTIQEPFVMKYEENQSLQQLFSVVNEDFLAYIHKLGLDINYRSTNHNIYNTSTTILTLKTTCFKVDFNEDFVTIAPIKKR